MAIIFITAWLMVLAVCGLYYRQPWRARARVGVLWLFRTYRPHHAAADDGQQLADWTGDIVGVDVCARCAVPMQDGACPRCGWERPAGRAPWPRLTAAERDAMAASLAQSQAIAAEPRPGAVLLPAPTDDISGAGRDAEPAAGAWRAAYADLAPPAPPAPPQSPPEDAGLRCPTCHSPQPSMHPAAGEGGEVCHVCPDPYHGPAPDWASRVFGTAEPPPPEDDELTPSPFVDAWLARQRAEHEQMRAMIVQPEPPPPEPELPPSGDWAPGTGPPGDDDEPEPPPRRDWGGYPAPHYDEYDDCPCPDHSAMRAGRDWALHGYARGAMRWAPSRRATAADAEHAADLGRQDADAAEFIDAMAADARRYLWQVRRGFLAQRGLAF